MPNGAKLLEIQEFPDICCGFFANVGSVDDSTASAHIAVFYCERPTVVDSCTINSSDYDFSVANFQSDVILKYAPSGTDPAAGGTALSLNAAFDSTADGSGRSPAQANEAHYNLVLLDGDRPGRTETIATTSAPTPPTTATVNGVGTNVVPAGNWIYLVLIGPVSALPAKVRMCLRLRTKQR